MLFSFEKTAGGSAGVQRRSQNTRLISGRGGPGLALVGARYPQDARFECGRTGEEADGAVGRDVQFFDLGLAVSQEIVVAAVPGP